MTFWLTPGKGPEVLRFAGRPEPPAWAIGSGRLPDFLMIGAPKAGTTSMWFYLKRHPRLFFASPKALEFFTFEDRFERGPDWYRAFFAGAGEGQLCGEASPYARWPHSGDVAGRIAQTVPPVKLIYMIRNPVERTYAQYRHRMRLPVPRLTFAEAIENDPQFVDTSLYMTQIKRVLAHFPREQLCCVLTDDLKDDPSRTLARVQEFLGVEERDLTTDGEIVSNSGSSAAKDDYARQRIRKKVKAIPGVRRLSKRLPTGMKDIALRKITSSRLGHRLKSGYKPGPMTPETESMLIERFREPNADLERFLGRDLSHWSIPKADAA